MADRTRSLVFESADEGGSTTEYDPKTLNPNEDGLDARAYHLQNTSSTDSDVVISRDASDNLTFADGVVAGVKTLSDLIGGLTEANHRTIDQLAHDLDESYYEEYTRDGWKVTNVTVWTTAGKTLKIREYDYTWTGTKVTQEVQKQYDGGGSLVETITIVYAYSGGSITSATATRS